MEKKYLIVNLGSSSKKYSLFSQNGELFSFAYKSDVFKLSTMEDFLFKLKKLGFLNNVKDITAVGLRVVAPGSYFVVNKKINLIFLRKLEWASFIAPLHVLPLIKEIKEIQSLIKNSIIYGISDSAFHATMPKVAKLYALPPDLTKKLDIYRFGYHGISCTSIVYKLKQNYDLNNKNLVICHLGGGSSITAIKKGESIETSMGFTPLEGLPMITRSGNIDPSIVCYFMQKGFNIKKIQNTLFNKSGIFGLVKNKSMENIIKLADRGDENSLFALEFYSYNIIKTIASYYAILGNIDLLVFTGGIGENAPYIRSLICNKLKSIYVEIDSQKNNRIKEGIISSDPSNTEILVLKTEEMKQIFIQAKYLIEESAL